MIFKEEYSEGNLRKQQEKEWWSKNKNRAGICLYRSGRHGKKQKQVRKLCGMATIGNEAISHWRREWQKKADKWKETDRLYRLVLKCIIYMKPSLKVYNYIYRSLVRLFQLWNRVCIVFAGLLVFSNCFNCRPFQHLA